MPSFLLRLTSDMHNQSTHSWYWSGQTLKNLHQWSKAGGQTSLAKLTKHFCKITCRFFKLPVIFLHEWDPRCICVPVDVLFKLKQKVSNCPICITENMGPEGCVGEGVDYVEGKKWAFPERTAILEVTRITFKKKMTLRVGSPFEEGGKKLKINK